MAYSVAARKQEMGIRLALGAGPGDILGLVIGQGMRMTLIGIAAGIAASLALTRLLTGLLYGVRATDPLVFGGSALVADGDSAFGVLSSGSPRLARWIPSSSCDRNNPHP